MWCTNKLKKHTKVVINKQFDLIKKKYQIHLSATIDCIILLLKLGLTFCGDDESKSSKNKGDFPRDSTIS